MNNKNQLFTNFRVAHHVRNSSHVTTMFYQEPRTIYSVQIEMHKSLEESLGHQVSFNIYQITGIDCKPYRTNTK